MSINKKTLIDGDFQVGSAHFYVDVTNNRVGLNQTNPTSSLDVNGNAFIGTDMTVASNVTVGSNVIAQKFTGSASGLTSVPADQISGVIPVANGGTGTTVTTGTGSLVKSDNPTFTGTVTAETFSGSGASLTNIPMGQATGTLAVANGGTGVTTSTGTGNTVLSASPTLTGAVTAETANFSSNVSASNIYAGYDTDMTSYLGRAAVGFSGISDEATFAHVDVNSTNNYALKQTATGGTYVNSATSKSTIFSINDSEQARINVTGLGVGTNDPLHKLDVHGTANVGVLTCTSVSGDGSGLTNIAGYSWPTHANGNDIYYTTGNVGIGTETPGNTLEVAGTASVAILKSAASAATSTFNFILNGPRPGTTSGGAIHFINGSTRTLDGGTSTYTIRNDSGALRLGNASYNTLLEGNVGVGKTPGEKLDVEGIIRVNRNGGSLQLVGTDHTYIEYYPDGVSSGRKAYVGYAGGSDNNFTISNSAGSGHVILAGGSVGIGVTDPDSKLEVRGNIRASFSDTNHGMFIDAGGTILRNYGGNGVGLHFTTNAIWPTNYLGAYSAGGIDLGSSSYRWNNVYTEALNASGTIDSSGIITCNANKMVITGSSPTLYLRDSDERTGMIHQNANRMYFLSGPANSDSWVQTANSRWPLYLQMDTNEAVFGGNIDASVGTVTASTFSTTSQLYLGTSASIRQSSTPGWTGDPGSGVGKLEYHSNRWYIVAGSNSTELLRVRRNESDKFAIDNNGSISVGIVPAARISGTVGTATNQSGGTVSCTSGSFSGQFSASTASSRDKFRVYPASSYCIGMQSGVTYGDLNDWAMTFQMNNDDDRGFWWGDDGHGVNQGAMALSTRGWLNVAERIKVGGGQTDTGAAGWNLQVQGNGYISSTLECDGRIYADNGCHVRGDWLRVNGQAGIYFESYGGGWWMTDSTYIRNYNSKMLQIEGSGARIYGTEATVNYSSTSYAYRATGLVADPANYDFSMYVQRSVRAAGYVAFSDRRIKSNVVDINDTYALEQVRKLKPKYYEYVDKSSRGDSSVIGFIAQEVKEVVPRAVSVSGGDVPNIYETGNIGPGNTITFTKFDTSTLESSTKTLIVYLSKQDRKEVTVTEVIDKHTLRVEEDISEWGRSMDEDGKLIYEEKIVTVTPDEYKNLVDKIGYEPVVTGYSNGLETISVEEYHALEVNTGYSEFIGHYEINKKIYEGSEIFVWGQKVNDFHHLNKDYLWTIGTAALQEVDRQQQADKVRISELETQLASVLTRLDALESA